MSEVLPAIGDLLHLVAVAPGQFRSIPAQQNPEGAIFGGIVLGQSLNAALQTIEDDRVVHSLHAYFLRRGRGAKSISYGVEKTHEGRSFSTRRVIAKQGETTLFHMECSFQNPEPGVSHEDGPRLDPPDPDSLPSTKDMIAQLKARLDPALRDRLGVAGNDHFDLRFTHPQRTMDTSSGPVTGMWIRVPSAQGLSPLLQTCVLAYASDAWLSSAVSARHPSALGGANVMVASLDHAMWFHAAGSVKADDWLYHEIVNPWAGGGRALMQGRFYDRAKRLIATTTQEVLIRAMPK